MNACNSFAAKLTQVGGMDLDVRAAAGKKLIALQHTHAEDLAAAMTRLQDAAAVRVLICVIRSLCQCF